MVFKKIGRFFSSMTPGEKRLAELLEESKGLEEEIADQLKRLPQYSFLMSIDDATLNKIAIITAVAKSAAHPSFGNAQKSKEAGLVLCCCPNLSREELTMLSRACEHFAKIRHVRKNWIESHAEIAQAANDLMQEYFESGTPDPLTRCGKLIAKYR